MVSVDRKSENKELLNCLSVILRTAQIHHTDNVAVINAIKKFLSVLNPLLSSDGSITLQLAGEFFQLNGNRIRYSMNYIFNYEFLIREFKKRELGSLIFKNTLQEEDVKALLSALLSTGFSETPFETLSKSIEGIENISIDRLKKTIKGDEELDRKNLIKKTYFSAVSLTKNISDKIAAGERVSLKKAKRVMEVLLDQIIEDESLLIGITTLKDYDDYTYHHSVNVSILSLAFGYRLGLPKKTLSEIGLSALFHDIGKTGVPKEILNKTTEFTDEEWKIIKFHPIWGAWTIFRIKGIDLSSIQPALTAFEHHLNFDLSGYPKLKKALKLDFFSRIIAIADQYDAMTSSRIYERIPLSPDKALSVLLDKSGSQLDPYLVKIFINMIGIYPIGTLVMLDTNELGLVFESNKNLDFIERPRVILVTDSTGKKINRVVDLMERDEKGNFKRNITKTLDPNKYNINLAEHLI